MMHTTMPQRFQKKWLVLLLLLLSTLILLLQKGIVASAEQSSESEDIVSPQILHKNFSQNIPDNELRKEPTLENCRLVFSTQHQGGLGETSLSTIQEHCSNSLLFNVCEDLQDFTGLNNSEFNERMERKGRFHFEGEHLFWNPTSKTELAWYYATSVNYLFANAIHPAVSNMLRHVENKTYEPILDYSGGVGNNILYLAKKEIKVQYFGIGMAEYAFARYRVEKHGVEEYVEFKHPYSAGTGFKFNPIDAPLPRDCSLGSILAMDVLEHIPEYHNVVRAMVESLRMGGIIVENTPFGRNDLKDGEEDLRVHLAASMPMEEAMGLRMKKIYQGVWKKIAED